MRRRLPEEDLAKSTRSSDNAREAFAMGLGRTLTRPVCPRAEGMPVSWAVATVGSARDDVATVVREAYRSPSATPIVRKGAVFGRMMATTK